MLGKAEFGNCDNIETIIYMAVEQLSLAAVEPVMFIFI
jgi:hypothetical protein